MTIIHLTIKEKGQGAVENFKSLDGGQVEVETLVETNTGLLRTGKYTDVVVFIVGGDAVKIKARSKLILKSRCLVFDEFFEAGLGTEVQEIHFPEIELDTFKTFVLVRYSLEIRIPYWYS